MHWAAPLGAVLLGRFQFVPGAWLAFFVVILIHELGHAAVVKAVRAHVEGIDLNFIGGVCKWHGSASPFSRALIAWGGVWAQLPLAIATFILLFAFGEPSNPYLYQATYMLS